MHDKIAAPLGISIEEAAAGIKAIADHRMADLLDTLTVGHGHDPRDFVVMAYGGAGGSHCHRFGAELGAQSIIVPATATVHSAYGAAPATCTSPPRSPTRCTRSAGRAPRRSSTPND